MLGYFPVSKGKTCVNEVQWELLPGALWLGNGWGLGFTSGNNPLYIFCLSDTQFRFVNCQIFLCFYIQINLVNGHMDWQNYFKLFLFVKSIKKMLSFFFQILPLCRLAGKEILYWIIKNLFEIISNTDYYNKDIVLLPDLEGWGRKEMGYMEECHTKKEIRLWNGEGTGLSCKEQCQLRCFRNYLTNYRGEKAFVFVTNYLKFLCFSDINSAHGATFVLSI